MKFPENPASKEFTKTRFCRYCKQPILVEGYKTVPTSDLGPAMTDQVSVAGRNIEQCPSSPTGRHVY